MPTRIAFIAEDRHFAGRTLPLLLAARELGCEADVLTSGRDVQDLVERVGARPVPLGIRLSSVNPMSAGYAAGQVAAALKASRPDLVHAIGLGPSLLGGAGCAMARIDRRLYSVGPLGGLALPDDNAAWLARRVIRTLIKGPLRTPSTRFVFETEADPPLLGLDPANGAEVVIMPGSGVDPERFRPVPMPPSAPLRIAIAAAPTWANGIDVAVKAVQMARTRDIQLEMSLFLDAEGARLGRFGERTLAEWEQVPGVRLQGPAPADPAFWDGYHVACLPARGGAGIPAFLLQAASCGRPLIATNIPGCRGLVTDGSDGFLVPPDDPAALADAFGQFAADPVLAPRMGAAARARVLHGFLERDLIEAAKKLYASMLPEGVRS